MRALAIFTLGLALLAGCATNPREPSEAPTLGNLAARHALAMQGKPYRYGGNSPNGFDCSGLVQYSYAQAGVRLPRSTEALWKASRSITMRDVRPGDLLFFTQLGKRSSHVALYVGDNRFVHAPSTGKSVYLADLNDTYWRRHFEGARRPRL
ncbi:MAG: C40 family peptidase [Sulfurifustis sp.]